MSRYVKKPHGLTLGSANWFFIVGDGDSDNRTDYRAIVSTRGYGFDQCDSLNVRVLTPAQQLIWIEAEYEMVDSDEPIHKFYPYQRYWHLREWWVQWLTREVGPIRDRWDVRSKCETPRDTLFFKRRKDALAFCNQVDERLKGIKFSDF